MPTTAAVGIDELDDALSGQQEGLDVPFDPANACCNAPCPPGAFCNTKVRKEKTQFFVQKWTCVWTQTPLACQDPRLVSNQCAWTKAWRCNFLPIERCDVLKAFCCRKPPRCPQPEDDRYSSECDCFVPEDAYFAKVFEIEYVECSEKLLVSDAKVPPCHLCDDTASEFGGPNPAGCACCGLAETAMPRWVRIHCKAQIPPEFTYEVPLPYYERPAERSPSRCMKRPGACSGSLCKVDRNANKSPDFWRSPSLPYA